MKHSLENYRVGVRGILAGLLVALGPAAGAFGGDGPGVADGGSSLQSRTCLSPTALAATPDGKTLFIACDTARQVASFDLPSGTIVTRLPVPDSPSGLALSADGLRLYVTCAAPHSTVCVLDTLSGKTLATIPTEHTAMAPVLGHDETILFVCNRFNDAVAVIDLKHGREVSRIPVEREPVAAALTPDGRLLFVANHLPRGTSDRDVVACAVSVIDTVTREVVQNIPLPSGSTLSRGVCVSPDGRFVGVTHGLARFHLPVTQVEHGWVSNSALSLIDVAELKLLSTVLLDGIDHGAANPWATAWSDDGRWLCVTHAGTHELSVIDAPELLARVRSALRTQVEVHNDLSFLTGLRRRIELPGNGPRALALVGSRAHAAAYFSDSLATVDVSSASAKPVSVPLQSPAKLDSARKGELLFNDATICFQGWQSCASCHSADARVDGMNWDLTNDGIGNPKNAKSLLHAFQTPPSMALGVRSDAAVAVRAGIRHTLFVMPQEDDALAIDAYLQSLRPIPSPHLVDGRLSDAAARGETLFFDPVVGCAECHPPPWFTDLQAHEVGTAGRFDSPADRFDTPTLIELWRTAPYLHDGSAATVREAITTHNREDQHGRTSHLSPEQIEELVAYLLSL